MKNVNMQEMLRYAIYFVVNQTTVRGVAKHFKVSKTHVHNQLIKMTETKFCYEKNEILGKEVRKLLDKNKCERHIRGGNATKLKYLERAKNK